ncbi:MAG: DUF1330 domain-containing protein [Pseudomonadota bacterium]
MAYLEPTGKQLKSFSTMPSNGPIVMVNLLKFKASGGRESYAQYAAVAGRLVNKIGGRVIHQGEFLAAVIGDGDWDEVLLAEYPSREAFFRMIGWEEYQAVVHFRSEALADSRLWATRPE